MTSSPDQSPEGRDAKRLDGEATRAGSAPNKTHSETTMKNHETPQAVEAVAVTQADREYRKTATIRARQWWQMGDHPAVELASDVAEAIRKGEPVPFIFTMEGGYLVTPGDWIATGVQGEHWAIKPDIFAATYEPVEPPMDFGEAIDPNASHNRRAITTPPPAETCAICGNPNRNHYEHLAPFTEGYHDFVPAPASNEHAELIALYRQALLTIDHHSHCHAEIFCAPDEALERIATTARTTLERIDTADALQALSSSNADDVDELLVDANSWYSEAQLEEMSKAKDAIEGALPFMRHDRGCLARKGAHYGDESCDCGVLKAKDALRQDALQALSVASPREVEDAGALERAEAAQLNLFRQAERDRELRRRAEEAFSLVSPWVAKFAAAVDHYNRTPPRYKGSTILADPDPGYEPALHTSIHGRVPPNGPTIADLRMLAEAYTIARTTLDQG